MDDGNETSGVKWEDKQSAFQNRIKTAVIINLTHKDPILFLENCSELYKSKIKNALEEEESLKVHGVFCGTFKLIKGDEQILESKYINTRNAVIFRDTNLTKCFDEIIKMKILNKLEEFSERGSGWTLSSVNNLRMCISKYTPQLGSSYIDLPAEIKNKHACINVKNKDNMCFAWAIVSCLYPMTRGKHPDRTSSYPHPSECLNLTGIQFPMEVSQISQFENQNNISVNVYLLKKDMNVKPIILTENKRDDRHVNLLLIKDGDVDPPNQHYVWIKDLSRLLSTQVSKHNGKIYICDRCLHYFISQEKLDKHSNDCKGKNEHKIYFPEEKLLTFKNYKNKITAPFVIYVNLSDKTKYQKYNVYSIACYVKCSYNSKLSYYWFYSGKDYIHSFVEQLNKVAKDVNETFRYKVPMNKLTPDEINNFENAVLCHICEKPFFKEVEKVKDHCHLTGKFRGPAHKICNLNYKDDPIITVVFQKLSIDDEDTHFIIESLTTMDFLLLNDQCYITFSKSLDYCSIKLRFIDSFRFMNSGIDKMVTYLTEFPILESEFKTLNSKQLKLLIAKTTLYSYDSNMNHEDNKHTCKIRDEFKIKDPEQYSNLYLKRDVLLLADIFEKFRSSTLNTYGLDPAKYYTLSELTWDAMLKHTNTELELLNDVNMIEFIKKGIRGGLSQCSKRYAKANNQYISDFNQNDDITYLMHFDINNQHEWAMSQYLPNGEFQWCTDLEIENLKNLKIENLNDYSQFGYILEVDLDYSQRLHDLHADLPFCPEYKHKKVMATVFHKEQYVIHYRNLKQALFHGLEITKIHKVLKFKQDAWLKSYIDFNANLRKHADNAFERNLYNLMNNCIFEKIIERVRKDRTMKLVSQWKGRYAAEALIAKSNFKSLTIFKEKSVAIELNKNKSCMNKPIYIGMCVLDMAKITTYKFHYEYMKNAFKNKCKILYTDTDSLIYEISNENVYEVIRKHCYEYFDTSDYPDDNIYSIPKVNKRILGMTRDENNGRTMTEFVGLRSKMYSYRVKGDENIENAKDVKKIIMKNRITFDDYMEYLNEGAERTVNQDVIQSKFHNNYAIDERKIAFSDYVDKRYLVNKYDTLPLGHCSIMDTN